MELREFAARVVYGRSLAEKLSFPDAPLSDLGPGPPERPQRPGRDPALEILPGGATRVPPIEGMHDPAQRARIVHALANHELQAVELFAWALLAFPDAPPTFRRGVLGVLREEQMHTVLYERCLESYGVRLGEFTVSGYFWNRVARAESPREFVCAMSLTFENANLDHTVEYAAAARAAGDEELAAVIDRVHRDEIGHVRFGWEWLGRFKAEEESMWNAYRHSLKWPVRPALARGAAFHPRGRERAGLEPDFVERLGDSAKEP